MKRNLFLICMLICTKFSIAQVDTSCSEQLTRIFDNLPLNEKKETWRTIIENRKGKYIDTLKGIPNVWAFIMNDISFYQTISKQITRANIKIASSPISNKEKTILDTVSAITMFLFLTPGTTKKEAKSIYMKFRRIVACNYIYENSRNPRGTELRRYVYSNHQIDQFPPLHCSLAKVKEKETYTITIHYQKLNRGTYFIQKNLF